MDRPREASLFGGSLTPSPTPPLALSDLLAQKSFPTFTPPYTHYLVTQDAADAPDDHSVQVVANGNETQASPELQELQDVARPASAPELEMHEPPLEQVPSPVTDWQAKRHQLRPSRHQGSKADWIRGWSEGVGAHGCETYCACSESSSLVDQGFISIEPRDKSGMRAMLRVRRVMSSSTIKVALPTSGTSAPRLCSHCGRMTSPPNSAPSSLKDEEREIQPRGRLARKLSGLFQRALPSWRKDGYSPKLFSTATIQGAGPRQLVQTSGVDIKTNTTLNRLWLRDAQGTEAGRFAGDSKQPILNLGPNTNLVNGRGTVRRASSDESQSDSDDSKKPRAEAAIAKRQARLRRAEKLLQKSAMPSN